MMIVIRGEGLAQHLSPHSVVQERRTYVFIAFRRTDRIRHSHTHDEQWLLYGFPSLLI